MRIGRACTAALLGLMLLAAGAIAQSPGVQGGESGSMLDTLFAKLQTATDPVAVQELEQAIGNRIGGSHRLHGTRAGRVDGRCRP